MQLTDRVALVTAGSRGLGEGIVRQLASQGADIAFTYLQDDAAASATVQRAIDIGRRCISIRADVSDFDLAHSVVDRVAEEFGRVDILVL